jgi:hypothetical protein
MCFKTISLQVGLAEQRLSSINRSIKVLTFREELVVDLGGGRVIRLPKTYHEVGLLRNMYLPFAVEVPTLPGRLSVGDYAVVPKTMWMDYQARAFSKQLEKGVIEFGGIVRIENISGGELVVRYTQPRDEDGGTRCPSGTRFSMPEHLFRTFTPDYVIERDAQLEELQIVAALLAQRNASKPKDSGDWEWARCVNPIPMRLDLYDILEYGDSRAVGRSQRKDITGGGTITQLGVVHNTFALWEYKSRKGIPYGSTAPTGMLYFGLLNGVPVNDCITKIRDRFRIAEEDDCVRAGENDCVKA